MAQSPHDTKVESTVGMLLRWGVMISAGVVLAAGTWYLVVAGGTPRDYRHFHPEAENLRSVPGVIEGALHLNCSYVIQLGLLLLIATPVARVAFTVFAFLEGRDWMYVGITLLVFAILLFSLAGAQQFF